MKPISIRSGSVEVKIYQQADGRCVVVYWEGGERKRQYLPTLDKAKEEAKRIADAISSGQLSKLRISASEIEVYLEAVRILKPTGTPLLIAASQFVEAHKKLNGRPLLQAIDQYVTMFPTNLKRVMVAEAADEMLAEKKADGALLNYTRTIARHLRRIKGAFSVALLDVREDQINTFLRSLKCSARSRNDTRRHLVMLFNWAGMKGYVPKNFIDPDKIAEVKEPHLTPAIYTPDELRALIKAARMTPAEAGTGFNRRYLHAQGLLPLLVLGAFAGMRSSEVEGQLWSDIKEDRGFIRVTKAKPGTPAKRLVEIQPNLAQWLSVCKRPHDVCCKYDNIDAAIGRLADRAKIKWKRNALRHSFISYRLALIKDTAKVALEAGNSPQVIFSNYRELVTEAEAKEWFAIEPTF